MQSASRVFHENGRRIALMFAFEFCLMDEELKLQGCITTRCRFIATGKYVYIPGGYKNARVCVRACARARARACVSIYSFKSYLFKIVEKRSFSLHKKSYYYKSNFLLIFFCSWFHNQNSDKNLSKIFVVELKKKT